MCRLTLPIVLLLSTVAISAEPAVPARKASAPPASSIRVECYGKLHHGMMAIGGETTGTKITFDRMSWELNLPDETSREFASQHDKKDVVATGSLRKVAGVAIRERWIIDVEKLTEREKGSEKVGATIVLTGQLKSGEKRTGKISELRVEADCAAWPLDFSEDKALAEKAHTMIDKPVVVTGLVDRIPDTGFPLQMSLRVTKLFRARGDMGSE